MSYLKDRINLAIASKLVQTVDAVVATVERSHLKQVTKYNQGNPWPKTGAVTTRKSKP